MFGRGKFNAGVLIDPRYEYKFDRNDQEKIGEFRKKIWWALEVLVFGSRNLTSLHQADC